jgi:cytochrome c oxidase assembly protein subunit 15
MWLHWFARLVAAATLVLIVAGGMVTSTGSGLAVPDWPTTYGYSMFGFPLSRMVGGIFYEHGHRLIASSVGCLTIALAIWIWRVEPRRRVRLLAAAALAAVVLQGLLGGLTVRLFLPPPVSIGHAGLAQIFFCLTVGLALFTSPGWHRGYGARSSGRPGDRGLARRAALTTGLVYIQILLGATMRHTGAGLAIPDFPLVFGGVLPPDWTPPVAIHFAHRAGALVVAAAVWMLARHVRVRHPDRQELATPAWAAVVLVVVQIALGGWTVLSARAPWVNTAHVATGALVLATTFIVTIRACRPWLLDESGGAVTIPAAPDSRSEAQA